MKSYSKITARYAETDMMGIIHHSVYPIWFEVARTEYIKNFGISYKELEEKGIMMPLIGLEVKFIIPIYYDDDVLVEAFNKKISPAKMIFGYNVLKSGDKSLLASGTTTHGFVDSKTFKPVNFKKNMPELFDSLKKSEEI